MSEQQMREKGAQNASRDEIKFTVYGDPIPKGRPRVVNGHAYTPQRTKDQEWKIAFVYKSIYGSFKFEKGIPLRMVVDAYFKIAKSDKKSTREAKISRDIRHTSPPDADNIAKCVQDGANGVIYEDDSQIVELTARKFYSEEPRTEIYVAKI